MPKKLDKPFQHDHPHLATLNSAITANSFQCPSGTFVPQPDDLVLYYDVDGGTTAWRLDFLRASEEDLKRLAEACTPATFGLNDKDVLDETYRKAGQLDRSHFALNFDPERSGLFDGVRDVLLEGHDEDTTIRAELYKLNVYGPGHFFKVHKDTPRDDNMFASLVVVFPTQHTGGSLIFRQQDQDYTFDSASLLSRATTPSVAFVAFHSDIDHEVTTVTSGYRVTLTYNLFINSIISRPSDVMSILGGQEAILKAAFRTIITDASYLPEGGYIGFGLRHQYPLGHRHDAVEKVRHRLKGCDAVLAKVCDGLGLEVSLWIAYEVDDWPVDTVLCPSRADLSRFDCESETLWSYLRDGYEGKLLQPVDDVDPEMKVQWATELKTERLDGIRESWIYYGNEHSLENVYGTLCLLVRIEPYNARALGNA